MGLVSLIGVGGCAGALDVASDEAGANLDIRVIVSPSGLELHAARASGCRHTLDLGEVGACREERQIALQPAACFQQSTCLQEVRVEHAGEVLAVAEEDVAASLELPAALPSGAELVLEGCSAAARVTLPEPAPGIEEPELELGATDVRVHWPPSSEAQSSFTHLVELVAFGDTFRAACHLPVDEARVPRGDTALSYRVTTYALAAPIEQESALGRVRLFPAARYQEDLFPSLE